MIRTFKKSKKSTDVSQHDAIPPQISSRLTVGQTFRFRLQNNAGFIPISWASLRNLVWIGQAASGLSLFQSVRLKRITLYVPGLVTSSSSVLVPIEPRITLGPGTLAANFIGDAKSKSSSPYSAEGAKITMKVPQSEPAGQWHFLTGASTTTLPPAFEVVGPIGSVVDVQLVLRFASESGDLYTNTQPALVAASAALGSIYFNYLDNTTAAGAVGSANWIPTGVDNVKLAYGA